MTTKSSRRTLLKAMATIPLGVTLSQLNFAFASQATKEIMDMKPGEFSWHPENSPNGPVAIVVSLTDQRVHVYRNGIRIAVSTCSTGKKGHRTPTGVFTILQKDKHHHSSTYNNASMPNMNRLTWGGIALHAGHLPGYPASHGCIRLPFKFSEKLFTVTHVGTPVIIASGNSDPKEVAHPGLVLSRYAEDEFVEVEAALKNKKLPGFSHENNSTAPISVLISRADQSMIILKNGEIIAQGKATIKNINKPLGSHVFILNGSHNGKKGMAWHAVGYHHTKKTGFPHPEESVIKRVKGDPKVVRIMNQNLHPGMTLVFTDLPTHPDTRSGRDFVIMTTESS